MQTLFLLLALWLPQDSGLQDSLARVRADLAALEARLSQLEQQAATPLPIPPPLAPPDNPGREPVDPPGGPVGTGNYVRLFTSPPTERFMVRFTGPTEFPGFRSTPISWGPQGVPTAFLVEATIDPHQLPAGELDDWEVPVELLSEPWPIPTRLPSIPLQVLGGGDQDVAQVQVLGGETANLAGLKVSGWVQQWRPGVFECQVLLRSTDDSYFQEVSLGYPERAGFYCPDISAEDGFSLVVDGGLPFVWLAGQSTVRRFLVGREVTAQDRERFEHFGYMAKLIGPDSYQGKGGWGATGSRMPLLTPEAIGYDLALVRHEDSLEDAVRYVKHVVGGQSHPEFKHPDGLGPWHPRGDRTGGGSGGTDIHPYGGWGMTPGEMAKAWWQMRTTLERMPTSYYANGLPISNPEWFRPYEEELIKYQPFDTAHMQRAMLAPTVVVWGAGAPAAAGWLRHLPSRYDLAEPYPDEYAGEGHPHAHRADGWAATRVANAYAVTAPGPERNALRTRAEVRSVRMLSVMTPFGLTHRSGDINAGGPFAAWLNPNLWQLGKLPEGTTISRQIMTCIVANGAMAMDHSVFGDARMRPMVVQAAANSFFQELPGGILKTPPSGQVIVGGLEFGELYDQTTFGELDDSVNAWECQWHLVYAYRQSGDIRFLERAAEIMGHGVPLKDVPAAEYARTGSARAWWSYTPEVVAEIQALP